jgi:hypothetical protein
MTLVASGDLHIRGIIQDPTRSIELEVEGSFSPSGRSLTTLSNDADPTVGSLPTNMTDFYGHEQGGDAPTQPNAPTKCNTTQVAEQIKASWFDQSSDELGFKIQWQVNGGAFGNEQSVGAGVLFVYYNLPCTEGDTYACRVKAWNGWGDSSWCTDGTPVTGNIDCNI